MKCLRDILGVAHWDKIRNESILRIEQLKFSSKDNSGQQDSNTQLYIYVVAAGSGLIRKVSFIERFHCIAFYSIYNILYNKTIRGVDIIIITCIYI